MIFFNASWWYWDINGVGASLADPSDTFPERTRVYSTLDNGYISVTDGNYTTWVQNGIDAQGFDPTTRIDTEGNLTDVLAVYGITPNFS